MASSIMSMSSPSFAKKAVSLSPTTPQFMGIKRVSMRKINVKSVSSDDMKENTIKGVENVKEGAKEAAQSASENTKNIIESVANAAQDASTRAKDDAGVVSDKANEGAAKAVETAESIGSKAGESVKGAWDAAKNAVAGKE
ncbi:uncharacterized protein LOC126672173 [Mercurialis annua]|uniref:uncharacterized protein LOC126672173 n=1 Tax=Mercurialis annua TaxID=3986 RepID=UPI00215E8522|nr:uncharacterized protein LOC126672173 [Mercurialis annua]